MIILFKSRNYIALIFYYFLLFLLSADFSFLKNIVNKIRKKVKFISKQQPTVLNNTG